MPNHIIPKKIQRSNYKKQQSLPAVANKWEIIKHKIKRNIIEFPQAVIRIHRPRTIVEWLFYLFVIQLLLLAFLKGRANAQNVLTIAANNSHDNANNHHGNLNSTNHSMPMAHLMQQHSNFSPANIQAKVELVNNADFRAATISDEKNRKKPSAKKTQNSAMSIQLERNVQDARSLLTAIQNIAPAKLNRPIKSVIIGSILQRDKSFDNSPEQIAQNKLFDEHQEFIIRVKESMVYEFRDELLKMVNDNSVVVNSENEANLVRQLFRNIQINVMDELLLKIYTAAATYFKGGNCNAQVCVAIDEALKKNLSIEKLGLTSKYNEDDNHAFAVIGRRAGSQIDDISTWGNDWVIIDYWAYDNRLITAERFRKNPEQYSLYTDEKWKWGVESYETNPLEKYRQHEYYKKYAPVRTYLKYCQKKINYFRQLTNEFFYGIVENVKARANKVKP